MTDAPLLSLAISSPGLDSGTISPMSAHSLGKTPTLAPVPPSPHLQPPR